MFVINASRSAKGEARPSPVRFLWRCRRCFIVVKCCAVEAVKLKTRVEKGKMLLIKVNFFQYALKMETWWSSVVPHFCIFVFVLNWVLIDSLLLKANDSFSTWMLMLKFQPSVLLAESTPDLAQVTLMIL